MILEHVIGKCWMQVGCQHRLWRLANGQMKSQLKMKYTYNKKYLTNLMAIGKVPMQPMSHFDLKIFTVQERLSLFSCAQDWGPH